MQSPNPHDSNFGSEVRRLETPEHRRKRLRQGRVAAGLGVAMGAALLYVGVRATRTGEMVLSTRGTPITGPEACGIAILVLLGSLWVLWRLLTGKA
jgi:hypothetical protein